jgi:hypothetical protein
MLIIAGDRDDGALEPSIFLRRTARHGSLVVLPFTDIRQTWKSR